MTESLPGFARAWMAQWWRAAEQLSRIRDAQLRQLQPADELDAISLLDLSSRPVGNPHENGLVIQELTPLVELKEEPEILDRLQALYRSTANES